MYIKNKVYYKSCKLSLINIPFCLDFISNIKRLNNLREGMLNRAESK